MRAALPLERARVGESLTGGCHVVHPHDIGPGGHRGHRSHDAGTESVGGRWWLGAELATYDVPEVGLAARPDEDGVPEVA
jgi:hypothetical protein